MDRQVGEKLKSRGQRTQSLVRDKWECEIMRTTALSKTSETTSPETYVKSCGPSMHPFQSTKNSSQVNLFRAKEAPQPWDTKGHEGRRARDRRNQSGHGRHLTRNRLWEMRDEEGGHGIPD